MGANSPLANGSLIPCLEKAIDYMCTVIDKVNREDIKSICVKQSAEDQFVEYCDACALRLPLVRFS